MTDAKNQNTSYRYDEAGNLTGVTDALGRESSIEYDLENQITSKEEAGAEGTDSEAPAEEKELAKLGKKSGLLDRLVTDVSESLAALDVSRFLPFIAAKGGNGAGNGNAPAPDRAPEPPKGGNGNAGQPVEPGNGAKPEKKETSKPADQGSGKPEETSNGKPEDKGNGKPEDKANGKKQSITCVPNKYDTYALTPDYLMDVTNFVEY